MVLYNTYNKSPPTATHVLRVTKLRLERDGKGERVSGSSERARLCCLQQPPLQTACTSDSMAWLTPWPTGMLGVECDPNWGNVKSPRITSVARLSQRIQGDTALLLLLGVLCANESACANPPCATATGVHPAIYPKIRRIFFFFQVKDK